MKLRSKLFLGVGLLFLAMTILMYFVPILFIRKDVARATREINGLLIKDHQELASTQKTWLKSVLDYIKQNIDSLLFSIHEDNRLSQKIDFEKQNSSKEIWSALARIIAYDPSVGFVQAHAPQLNQTAVLTPDLAKLYSVDKISEEKGAVLLSISSEEFERKDFIGIPIPKAVQTDPNHTLYALISPERAVSELSEVNTEIAQLTPEFIQKKLSESERLAHAISEANEGFSWAIKSEMIRDLTPFFVEGLSLNGGGNLFVPEGLARMDQKGYGYVILSQEVFSTEPLFDDVSYYNQNRPLEEKPSIAKGTVLITIPDKGAAYVGNTIRLGGTYLTIASPLSILGQQLSLSSNKMIVIQVKENVWLGYNEKGQRIPENQIQALVSSPSFHDRKNHIRIATLENGGLVFYDFNVFDGEASIVRTLKSLEGNLSNRLSTQLLLIAIGTMVLVLLFIGRFIFTIINPIAQLANATELVAWGKYDEIVLPDTKNRQDEVAILSHSFGEMVTGLQEREKIRGVLDKVVSKDVAEEILKAQIHLGGEDREVTMLFGDIRGFTELSAKQTPQKIIEILNVCMTKISRVIEGEGGVIDKYVGDEVMAIFGAPTIVPDHALRAVSTGMLIIETLKKWNQERLAAGEPLVEMGMGIHTGIVVAGNMGAEDRLNYTVVGAHVNLASRLCDVAKPNQLIISGATLQEPNVESSFYTNALPPMNLKGFAKPIAIYEILGFKWEGS